MKKLKKIKFNVLALMLAVIMMMLTACDGAATPESSGKDVPNTANEETKTDGSTAAVDSGEITYPLTLKVGYSTSADDPRGVVLEKFKKTVEEKTNGDILVEIHPGGELGSDDELIAGIIGKKVDMTVSSAGNYAVYATRVGVSALPFLFDDFDSAWKFIDSETIQAVDDDLEEYNIHVLAYFDNGFRCVTTSESVGPVETVDDMKGLNIRTPDNQIVMETMSELEAMPKSFPFADLKPALKDGTFDAQENPIPVIYNNKLYEEQKYLSVTNHSYDAMPLTIRSDIWNSLSDEYRQIIGDAAKAAEKEDRELVKKQTEEYVSNLEKEGMVVVHPDLEPFKEKTENVMTVFADLYDEKLIQFVKNNT
ncbi:MAG: TRAP transporter substrate-binding protein [Firmicutes bacterium]|nr:TRAP transporter substrate-binding protein [Bacillota bacterium]